MAKTKRGLTTDQLGQMIKHGFDEVHEKIDERFKLIIDRFERVKADVGDIKRALGPLVQMMAAKDREMSEMELRLRRVERKVGIGFTK